MMDKGWSFETEFTETTGDELYNYSHLYKIYQKAQSDVSTSVTVPVLWDKKHRKLLITSLLKSFVFSIQNLIN